MEASTVLYDLQQRWRGVTRYNLRDAESGNEPIQWHMLHGPPQLSMIPEQAQKSVRRAAARPDEIGNPFQRHQKLSETKMQERDRARRDGGGVSGASRCPDLQYEKW